jgi:hypothetical protein
MKRRRAGGGGDEEELLDDRGRAARAARYILDGMRLFRISLGTLALLLFLALVCCILSSIFIGLDLKSDLSISVKLDLSISVKFIEDDGGEEPPPPPPQDGDGGELEPTCADGNPCTADYEFDSGGCESIPFPEGTPCEDVCIMGSQEGTCEYIELQKGITKPICTGRCLGSCDDEKSELD